MKNVLLTRIWAPVLALPILFLTSCQPQAKTADNTRHFAIDPALAVDVPFSDFTINTETDDTLKLGEGTSIFIPKGIFVDKNGDPVKGNINLHYRSFYTAGELAASGITMFYDTAGQKTVFTSAGEFEINGDQNGEPVSIAPDKKIAMNFASSRNDDTYSFYSLDTANAKWNFEYPTTAEPNAIRAKLEEALAGFLPHPVEPQKFDPAKPVIDLDVDISDHPELKGYAGIMWQYAGNGMDPEQNKWIYDEDWQKAKLTLVDTNTCKYDLNLSDNTRTFSTQVVPAINGDNYDNAIKKYRTDLLTFEAGERERQAKNKEIALTQSYQRRIMLPRFGVFNCDRPGLSQLRRWFHAHFRFAKSSFEEHRDNVAVFAISADGSIVSEYNGDENRDVFYLDGTKTCLIAVMRGTGEAEVMDSKSFAAAVNGDQNQIVDLQLSSSAKIIQTSEDIDHLIDEL